MTPRPNPNPWEPYDPRWLVKLARKQLPDDWQLHDALAACTRAQANSCCGPKICGYRFVDSLQSNQPESPGQYVGSVALQRESESDVIVDLLRDGRVGAIEFF